MKPQHTDDGTHCPLWRKPCVKVCHTCEWWFQTRGKNPQTNADMDHWSCAIALLPILQIETTQAQFRTTATVDKFRGEAHAANDQHMVGAIARLNRQLDEAVAISGEITSVPQKLLGA